jgi:hypothetical protein
MSAETPSDKRKDDQEAPLPKPGDYEPLRYY